MKIGYMFSWTNLIFGIQYDKENSMVYIDLVFMHLRFKIQEDVMVCIITTAIICGTLICLCDMARNDNNKKRE